MQNFLLDYSVIIHLKSIIYISAYVVILANNNYIKKTNKNKMLIIMR